MCPYKLSSDSAKAHITLLGPCVKALEVVHSWFTSNVSARLNWGCTLVANINNVF